MGFAIIGGRLVLASARVLTVGSGRGRLDHGGRLDHETHERARKSRNAKSAKGELTSWRVKSAFKSCQAVDRRAHLGLAQSLPSLEQRLWTPASDHWGLDIRGDDPPDDATPCPCPSVFRRFL